jgi:hypothetical protein
MVDDINNIFPKNKSSCKSIPGDDPFPDLLTESEKNYFQDYNPINRICEGCGHDHCFKPPFEGVKTSIERISDLIPLIFKEDLLKNV